MCAESWMMRKRQSCGDRESSTPEQRPSGGDKGNRKRGAPSRVKQWRGGVDPQLHVRSGWCVCVWVFALGRICV